MRQKPAMLRDVPLEALAELRGGECTVTVYPEQQAYTPGWRAWLFGGARSVPYRPRMIGISGDSCYDDRLLQLEQKEGGTIATGAVVLSPEARKQYVPARNKFRSGR